MWHNVIVLQYYDTLLFYIGLHSSCDAASICIYTCILMWPEWPQSSSASCIIILDIVFAIPFCQNSCWSCAVRVIKWGVEQSWVSAVRAYSPESHQVDDGQLQQLQNSTCCWHSKGSVHFTWNLRLSDCAFLLLCVLYILQLHFADNFR